jgi:hypothetical protein
VVQLVAGVWKRLGAGSFESRYGPIQSLFRTRRTSGGINLVKMDALAAGAIRHRLVEFSAKGAVPNGQDGKRKSVFAIIKVSAFFGLFRHVSFTACPGAFSAPQGRVGFIA